MRLNTNRKSPMRCRQLTVTDGDGSIRIRGSHKYETLPSLYGAPELST